MRSRLAVLGALLLVTSIAFACGSEGDNGVIPDGSSGGSSGGNSFGGGDSAGGGNGSSGGSGDAAACSAPVDMFIMFDRSGSMQDDDKGQRGTDCNIGGTGTSKWCRSINALSGYFNSASATGQAAALQFFPLATHSNALCTTGNGYDVPAIPSAAPPFVTLPSNAFDALLNSTSTGGGGSSGGTPTEAAIRGLTRFSAANRRGGHVTIGILVTDGDPNGCNETLGDLSGLLAAHYAATQIRTYVIGMAGATDANLEDISQGGNAPPHPASVGAITNACGTEAGPCRHWNVGAGDPTVFGAALAAIQESADGCKDGGGFVNPVK